MIYAFCKCCLNMNVDKLRNPKKRKEDVTKLILVHFEYFYIKTRLYTFVVSESQTQLIVIRKLETVVNCISHYCVVCYCICMNNFSFTTVSLCVTASLVLRSNYFCSQRSCTIVHAIARVSSDVTV